jgi:hypothetical protein
VNIEELTVAVHHLLEEEGVPHGFGGALALNLYTDPRATRDIDLSAFVPWDRRHETIPVFARLGFTPERSLDDAIPIAGIRLRSPKSDYLIDVFFAIDEHYEQVRNRLVHHPFGAQRELLPFFSADDIALFKVSFNRDKDWVDLRHLVRDGPPLDLDYIESTLVGLRGPTMHPRIARLRALTAAKGEELR